MKKEFFFIAWKNIRRHWKKSFITGASISLGFIGMELLGGYMIRMERYLTTQGIYLNHTGHIALYKKNGLERHLVEPERYSFSLSEQQTINDEFKKFEESKEIERIIPFIHAQGVMTNGCKSLPFLVWATDAHHEYYLRNHPQVLKHIPLLSGIKKGKGYWEKDGVSGVVISAGLAKLLHKPLVAGDNLEKISSREILITDCQDQKSISIIKEHASVQLLANTFEESMAVGEAIIVGQYSTGFSLSEDSSVMMPLDMAQSFYATDKVTSFGLYLKDVAQTKKMLSYLKSTSKKWNFEVDIYPYDNAIINPFYVGSMRFVYVMNLFFFIIVCGVIVLSLLNAIQIAIMERKREIGTLLAIGYRKSHIQTLFQLETLILTTMSLLAGILISYLLSSLVNSWQIPFDIVGNAEKLILKLSVEWWLSTILAIFFIILAYVSTSMICYYRLNLPVMKLLERAD